MNFLYVVRYLVINSGFLILKYVVFNVGDLSVEECGNIDIIFDIFV